MRNERRFSRRHFLAVSAAAAAGCTTAAPPVAPELRLGLIGCGARGMSLISEIGSNPAHTGVKIAAVCDVFRPRLQHAAGMANAIEENDWRRVIANPHIDAVIIATPDHWHAPMAISAMNAGKDVYCESPMAHTLDEARQFRACAARTGRVVQIGGAEACKAEWRAAAEIVRSGELGPVRWAQAAVTPGAADAFDTPIVETASPANLDWAAFLGDAPARPFEAARFFRWRNYWDYSGGIAANRHCGQIMPLLLALDDQYPERVSAAGGVYALDGRETPDSFVMNVEYAGASSAGAGGHTIVMSHSAAGGRGRPAVIRGDFASLEVETGWVRIIHEPAHSAAAGRLINVEPAQPHIADWLRCVKLRQRCLCDEEVGYRAMMATALAVEAYKTAKTMQFDARANALVEAPGRMSAA